MTMTRPIAYHDTRVRQYVLPTRILLSRGLTGDSSLLTATRFVRPCYPPPATCTIAPGGAVLVDFGQETAGTIRLVTGTPESHIPARIRIRLGESVSETLASPDNDHALHDFTLQVPWCGEVELGNTAFRFVHIEVAPDSTPLFLAQLSAVCLTHATPAVGDFHCSDDRLNQLWLTGSRTVGLCMQDIIVDGPKRDRLAWMGDTVIEARIIRAVFGCDPLIARTLDHLRDTTPVAQNMNTMATYSLWWIVAVLEQFQASADRQWLSQQRDYVEALVTRFAKEILASPEWHSRPAGFVDHPSLPDANSSLYGTRAIELLGLQAGQQICALLGLLPAEHLCRQAIAAMQKYQPALPAGLNKASTALLALAGAISPYQANQSTLSADPLHHLASFTGAFVLDARAMAGDHAGCLKILRRYYGGMLDLGATTFWEDFDITWLDNAGRIDELPTPDKVDVHARYGQSCYLGHRHSFCHGWSASPTSWLMREVLGVRPDPADPLHITLQPNLDTLDFATGTWPTPAGPLHIQHHRQPDGSVRTTWDAPDKRIIVIA